VRVVLDCNIWDRLARDEEARLRIAALISLACHSILIPATLRRELEASHFGGVPTWFPVEGILDGVFVLNHSRLGEARAGDGVVFSDHRGESAQTSDAVLVDTAHLYADVFVTEDKRARRRYARVAGSSRSIDYSTFRAQILGLSSPLDPETV
jgi:hypothetical protein